MVSRQKVNARKIKDWKSKMRSHYQTLDINTFTSYKQLVLCQNGWMTQGLNFARLSFFFEASFLWCNPVLGFKRRGSISHMRPQHHTPHKTVAVKYCAAWFRACFSHSHGSGHKTSEDAFATSRFAPVRERNNENGLGKGAPGDADTAIQSDSTATFKLIISILPTIRIFLQI